MENEEYIKNLPKKFMAAGALFFNAAGEVLIVHPTYKDDWEIPGGIVELNESPREAVEREVKEELGLSIKVERLVICDYCHATSDRPDNIQFIFLGGVLSSKLIDSIKIQDSEIKSIEFVSLELFRERFSDRDRLGPRVLMALEAIDLNISSYLENGISLKNHSN